MNAPATSNPRPSQPPPLQPQGTYEELLTGDKKMLTSDTRGVFTVSKPQLALYRFSSALQGSLCTDAITGATVRFPLSLYLPSTVSTAITPVSLLTVPAADDPTVTALYHGKVTDGRAPHYLWTHAYKLFGYDANSLAVGGGWGEGCAFEGGDEGGRGAEAGGPAVPQRRSHADTPARRHTHTHTARTHAHHPLWRRAPQPRRSTS
jgi:hypothetical protein